MQQNFKFYLFYIESFFDAHVGLAEKREIL